MEKKALGRGLSALIPERAAREPAAGGVVNLKLQEIIPNPHQPRKEFDKSALDDLAASIREKGIIQPVIVRKKGAQGYELIAGERRFRAANLLGLKEIPAIIKEANDEETLELSLIENIQREDLNPMETAQAYQELIDKFNFTQEKIARVVGKARATVNNTLRILKLPAKIKDAIRNNLLSFSHARALLEITDEKEQVVLAEKIMSSELSVRELEGLLKHRRPKDARQKRAVSRASGEAPYIKNIQEELQHVLGTKVRIIQAKKRGRIEIDFYSAADLERILGVLKK